MLAEILITRRSQFSVAPEGMFFEVSLDGFDSSGPSPSSDIYDNRYHDIYYYWSFDDAYMFTAPINLLASHKNANVAYGPMASHTFRAAGTYTVSCLVIEPASGKSATATLDVTIGDPNTFFAGSNTIFVDMTGAGTGKPTGARIVTSFDAAISAVTGSSDAVPKRIMLRRGYTYVFSGWSIGKHSNGRNASTHIVAESGASAKPILAFGSNRVLWDDIATTGNGNDKDFIWQNVVIQGGWDVVNETGSYNYLFEIASNPPNMLLFDGCTLEKEQTMINNITDTGIWPNSDLHHTILNDCTVADWGQFAIYESESQETALTGCGFIMDPNASSGGPRNGEAPFFNTGGPFRQQGAHKTIIHSSDFFSRTGWTDNVVAGYYIQQPCVRWNAAGFEGGKLNAQANSFEGGYNVFSLARMNGSITTHAVNAVIEKNYFVGNHMTWEFLKVDYGGLTVRNNVFVRGNNSSTISGTFDINTIIHLENYDNDVESTASPIKLYSNTLVNLQDGISMAEIENSGLYTTVVAQNNVIHQPNLSNPAVTDAPLDNTPIWLPREKGYIDNLAHPVLLSQYAAPATSVATYAPLTGSAALGEAIHDPVALDDFYGNLRPQYPSRGAFEMLS